MLSKTEAVWRHLLVGALEQGQRRQPSLSAVARELGLGVSTVHKAVERPVSIGAVIVHPSRGVRVIDPWRLLMLWAGKRVLERDVRSRSTTSLAIAATERAVLESGGILSGFGGLVDHMGDNPIGAYDTVISYGEPLSGLDDGGENTTLIVLEPDPLLARYGDIAPLGQCYVDLFTTPGWQAARFVEETPKELLGGRAG